MNNADRTDLPPIPPIPAELLARLRRELAKRRTGATTISALLIVVEVAS